MLQFQQSLKLLPSLHMQQGMRVLQAPLAELRTYVQQQILLNPFLDLEPLNSEPSEPSSLMPLTKTVEYTHSLFVYLLNQAYHTFSNQEDIHIAQYILGNLSEHGLFLMPLNEVSLFLRFPVEKITTVLRKIQQFDPLGIACSSLQEYWLLNLNKNQYPQAYSFIQNYYHQLQACDFSTIAKKTKIPIATIQNLLKQALSSIPWSPANQFTASIKTPLPPLPDIYLKYLGKEWEMTLNHQGLPTIRLNQETFSAYLSLSKKEQSSLSQHIVAAKWLLKHLKKREQTLLAVIKHIVLYQEPFLLGRKKTPDPLSVKTIAKELSFHESTIFRAVEQKVLATPIGLIPMKTLLPRSLGGDQNASKELIFHWIRKWVQEEETPLSDAAIKEKIQAKGITCARRTVAKYRDQLHIPPAHQRKKWNVNINNTELNLM